MRFGVRLGPFSVSTTTRRKPAKPVNPSVALWIGVLLIPAAVLMTEPNLTGVLIDVGYFVVLWLAWTIMSHIK